MEGVTRHGISDCNSLVTDEGQQSTAAHGSEAWVQILLLSFPGCVTGSVTMTCLRTVGDAEKDDEGLRGRDYGGNVNNVHISLIGIVTMNPPCIMNSS
jgi:hypothetical protein